MSVASHDANMAAMLAPKQRQRCNADRQATLIPRIQAASAKVARNEACRLMRLSSNGCGSMMPIWHQICPQNAKDAGTKFDGQATPKMLVLGNELREVSKTSRVESHGSDGW